MFKPYYKLLVLLVLPVFIGCSDDEPLEIIKDPDAPVISEEWKSWIKANSKEIKTPETEDFSDLEFLKELLEGKEIVQLGESSHGVKEFNSSKVRLIKYLHQELDYDVIAFESSIFDCHYAYNNELSNGAEETMRHSIFGVWYTQEVLELFDYILETQSTSNPLILAGVDGQHSSEGVDERPAFLRDIFSKISPELGDSIYGLDTTLIIHYYDEGFENQREYFTNAYNYFQNQLESNWDMLLRNYDLEILNIAKVSLQSNLAFVDQMCDILEEKWNEGSQARDENMAQNCKFLREVIYPGKKMIIWAHNFHIRYRNQEVKDGNNIGPKTMGYYLQELFKDDLYTIGFCMYSGQLAFNDRSIEDVKTHTEENIETVLYRSLYDYAFVDMLYQEYEPGNSWMFTEMKIKTWGYRDIVVKARRQYDGLFYVFETHAPDYLPRRKSDGFSRNQYMPVVIN